MNRAILSILAVLFPLNLLGQMFPLSDHYDVNALAINPAYAGCQDALSLTASYRDQWVGFKDAPKSYILSVHTPVYNDRMGLGLLVENNSIGIFKETSFYGNYAYRMELKEGKLALGLGFGVTVSHILWNELVAADENDIQLMNNPSSAVMPNFSLGMYYYTKKYYFGISMPLFLSNELDKNTGKYRISNNLSGCNYFFSGGYELGISPQVKFLPSVLIKYHRKNPVQIDYNARISLKDKLWIGMGYRSKDILVGMVQCQLNYQLRMGYSYDFTFGDIGKYMNGSHEFVLNYVFKYSRKVIGPRQF
jgi:type IX secretion system PorP/SprF family membrane protein